MEPGGGETTELDLESVDLEGVFPETVLVITDGDDATVSNGYSVELRLRHQELEADGIILPTSLEIILASKAATRPSNGPTDGAPRSSITGKKIRMHIEKDEDDLVRERARKEMLQFMNST